MIPVVNEFQFCSESANFLQRLTPSERTEVADDKLSLLPVDKAKVLHSSRKRASRLITTNWTFLAAHSFVTPFLLSLLRGKARLAYGLLLVNAIDNARGSCNIFLKTTQHWVLRSSYKYAAQRLQIVVALTALL